LGEPYDTQLPGVEQADSNPAPIQWEPPVEVELVDKLAKATKVQAEPEWSAAAVEPVVAPAEVLAVKRPTRVRFQS